MFTARAITSTNVDTDTTDCSSIIIFAHRASGMTSVGLNAVARSWFVDVFLRRRLCLWIVPRLFLGDIRHRSHDIMVAKS